MPVLIDLQLDSEEPNTQKTVFCLRPKSSEN